MNEAMYYGQAGMGENLEQLIEVLLSGETVIFIDGLKEAIHIGTKDVEKRSITQAETEQVILVEVFRMVQYCPWCSKHVSKLD